jgi:2-haloacid dehalogenase
LDRHEVKVEEALFIDDNYRNILAAEKLGINSIHFTSAQALKEKLKELAVL